MRGSRRLATHGNFTEGTEGNVPGKLEREFDIEHTQAVTAMPDLARLKQWHHSAIQLPGLEEFQTRLHER